MVPRTNRGPLLFGIAVATLAASAASANDLPVNIPANAAASAAGNFYVWAEGPWGPVRSPAPGSFAEMRNNPGAEAVKPGADANAVPPAGWDSVTVFGPPVAASMRGAVGYVFPDGTFSPTLGSRARLEFGASQTATSVGAMPGNQNTIVGSSNGGTLIGGCTGCSGDVATNYSGTRTSVKAASDYTVAGVTLTPSVSVLNGSSRQEFTPSASADPGGTMRWKDVGTAVGLESKVDLAPALTLNVGGHVGVGNREATLAPSAVDAATSRRNAAPTTGNAEARLTYKPMTELELKSFAGVRSYDSALPGISVAQGSAPQIKYGPDAGYYVGAGATYRFGTKD